MSDSQSGAMVGVGAGLFGYGIAKWCVGLWGAKNPDLMKLRKLYFLSDKRMENSGILYVFPVFHSAWLAKKISFPAEDDLFRDSLNEIEEKDERNQLIRRKAQAISGEILHWLLMAGAWVCIFIGAPIWVVLVLVGVFLLKTIIDFILMAYYQHKM